MAQLIHTEPAFAERFISYMVTRNIRIEADLVDQLFNSSEKRLARRCCCSRGKQGQPDALAPKDPQETLAEMVGATAPV